MTTQHQTIVPDAPNAADRVAALQASRASGNRERMAPAAEYRGAPTLSTLRNPTIWLFIGAVLLWAVGWVGYLTGTIGGLAAILTNSLASYVGFTVFHESVHRTAHQNRQVNDALGWLPALMLGFSYPVFRICHLKHHAHTNDPDLDPDHAVSHSPRALRLLWLVLTAVSYRRLYARHEWGTPNEKRAQMALDLVILASLPVGILTGTLTAVFVLFWGPMLIAGLFLFYAFDFLPHFPFDSTERFHDTRVQPGRVRHGLLLAQNYHLIHHLWVSVPWYRYRTVYADLEPQLLAKGIRVD